MSRARTAVRRRLLGVLAGAGGVVITLCAPGCTVMRLYENAPLRGDPAQLVEGHSTKSEVLRSFGPPTQITHQTDGDVFVYAYIRQNYSSFTLEEPFTGQLIFTYSREFNDRDTLVVVFDFMGIVSAVAVDHRTGEMPAL